MRSGDTSFLIRARGSVSGLRYIRFKVLGTGVIKGDLSRIRNRLGKLNLRVQCSPAENSIFGQKVELTES